ncbi:uncharacterized protein STEHIDRAFT_154408 [Stereum hirsutum FP-91666 SS1]|uniref:uncharacterized protein n=1 Tax=Stereum hirsutum (strain FP-91666) TaxID=721885 RepID=UPI000440C2C5|nr:uncharacterized protein STEHIDRAFT_154408 [Stereum hirsutum FP-91666 SS1]EIM88683.1 hypothetical protein STEHIDRAFT_154408 [Stereum hirsutum FP-91666 SS1]
MITLVVSSGVSALTNGSFVGMYHQWTVDSSGNKKGSHPINSTFDVTTSSDADNDAIPVYEKAAHELPLEKVAPRAGSLAAGQRDIPIAAIA